MRVRTMQTLIYRRLAAAAASSASSSTHNINLFIMYINELRAYVCECVCVHKYVDIPTQRTPFARRLTMGGATTTEKISMRNTKRASHTKNATPFDDLSLAPFMPCHCNAHASADATARTHTLTPASPHYTIHSRRRNNHNAPATDARLCNTSIYADDCVCA